MQGKQSRLPSSLGQAEILAKASEGKPGCESLIFIQEDVLMQGSIRKWVVCMLAVVALAAGSASALGNGYDVPNSDPAYGMQAPTNQLVANNTYASLESRLSALETRLADDEEDAEDECPKLDWKDTSGDKFSANCKWGGRIMGDYVNFAHQDAASLGAFGNGQDYFEFRRLRIFTEGEGFGVYDYKFQIDFEPENSGAEAVSIKDMFVGIHEVPFLGYVRMGNFKEPFSMEEITSSKYITFLERALPNIFAPSRHVGIQSLSYTDDERWTLFYGAFFEDISQTLKERVDDNQGIDLMARLGWNPIYTAGGRGVLHLGAGYVWTDDRDDVVRFRSRPETHESIYVVDTGELFADNYHRFNFELAGVYGPFCLHSELFYVDVNGITGELEDGSLRTDPDSEYWGAFVYGSWFLTGENKNYSRIVKDFGRVKPNTNFWWVRTMDGRCDCGWGAWELAARWSYLDLSDAFAITGDGEAGLANNMTLGVNWYWNPYTRLMFNYIRSWGSVPDADDDVTDTGILSMRWQIDF
jgi:phosphate-selective porin OprO/OprP